MHLKTVRVLWLSFELVLENSDIESLDLFNKVLNRACMCVFIVVFNSLLFYWIDTVHTTVNAALAKGAVGGWVDMSFLTPLGRILFYGANVLIILLVVCSCFIMHMLSILCLMRCFVACVTDGVGHCSCDFVVRAE